MTIPPMTIERSQPQFEVPAREHPLRAVASDLWDALYRIDDDVDTAPERWG